jgi:hypothetical protein
MVFKNLNVQSLSSDLYPECPDPSWTFKVVGNVWNSMYKVKSDNEIGLDGNNGGKDYFSRLGLHKLPALYLAFFVTKYSYNYNKGPFFRGKDGRQPRADGDEPPVLTRTNGA